MSGKFKRSERLKERQRKEHLGGENSSETVGGGNFAFSLNGLSNHDFTALGFICRSMRAVQISRALRKSDLILCVHNK